jgi:hypothetical protein
VNWSGQRNEEAGLEKLDQPPQPNAASNATGVPTGSSPITPNTVSVPFGTFRFASTSPA